jgi:hypothetical protein
LAKYDEKVQKLKDAGFSDTQIKNIMGDKGKYERDVRKNITTEYTDKFK